MSICQRIKDICINFFNATQKWNSLTIEGLNYLKEVVDAKVEIMNYSEENTELNMDIIISMQKSCLSLQNILHELKTQLKKMEKSTREIRAIQQLQGLNLEEPIFQFWTTPKLCDAISAIASDYKTDFDVKCTFIKKIIFTNQCELINVMGHLWSLQPYFDRESEVMLKAMELEFVNV